MREPPPAQRQTAPRRTPSVALVTALVRVAGASLLAMAALAAANRELDTVRGDIRVVVLVGVLAKLTLGTGLLVLSRYIVRRVAGAFFGVWLISALCTMYLLPETLVRIPGVSVQVTLPGHNVLNTANLNAGLAGGRPAWFVPVEIALALLCLTSLMTAVASSASMAAHSLQPPAAESAQAATSSTPSRPARTTPAGSEAATRLEVRTAVDPWASEELAAVTSDDTASPDQVSSERSP